MATQDEKLTQIQIDAAVSRQILEDFVNKTFPAHERADNETAKIARSAHKKISRAVWMSGGAVVLLTAVELARAFGIIQ